jgi:hypothetical protein
MNALVYMKRDKLEKKQLKRDVYIRIMIDTGSDMSERDATSSMATRNKATVEYGLFVSAIWCWNNNRMHHWIRFTRKDQYYEPTAATIQKRVYTQPQLIEMLPQQGIMTAKRKQKHGTRLRADMNRTCLCALATELADISHH